jgi:hypothetical protein
MTNLGANIMASFTTYVPVIAALAGISLSLLSLACALMTLKLKSRVRKKLLKESFSNLEIQRLQKIIRDHDLTIREIENARTLIGTVITSYPKDEKRLLEKGLYQKSRSGTERYISELLASKTTAA